MQKEIPTSTTETLEGVFICSAFRTPIGAYNGQYSNIPAHHLGSCVLYHCLRRAEVDPADVNEVIMGQVLTTGTGQNPARQASILAGIPPEVPAYTVNMVCASGMRAICNGYLMIKSGDASIILAGGQENMSMASHCVHLRGEKKIGDIPIVDTLLNDGLTCSFLNVHMGVTADHLAQAFEIPREIQDKYALMSQLRAAKALENGAFINEVVQTHENLAPYGVIVDEFPRKDTTLAALGALKPAFNPVDGTVTAGNSTGLNDGAAAVLLASSEEVLKRNLVPQVKIIAFSEIGCDPMQMALAPVSAIKLVLKRANWSIDQVDLFEINEAFAVQAMLCVNILDIDLGKVNVSGGAIALGHPLGATGARIVVTLVHNMERLQKNRGVAALCIGGGMAVAIALQRCEGAGKNLRVISDEECGNQMGDTTST